MSKLTNFLKLFKWDTTNASDLGEQFNIEKSMNENWDKIDEVMKENADAINQNGIAIGKNQTDIIDLQESLINKVDKEIGKGLSSNDFTNEDKAKLDELDNYDDSKINEVLRSQIPSRSG